MTNLMVYFQKEINLNLTLKSEANAVYLLICNINLNGPENISKQKEIIIVKEEENYSYFQYFPQKKLKSFTLIYVQPCSIAYP